MSNSHIRKAKAEVQAELLRLNKVNKGLRPSEVVADAERKDSPLHGEFLWDNKKAGHEFRLQQARTLIRVVVTVIPQVDGSIKLDPWVHVPPTRGERVDTGKDEGVYVPLSVLINNPDQFTRALEALIAKMNAAIAAAEQVRDAAETAGGDDLSERTMRIAMAITALNTASAAVGALH